MKDIKLPVDYTTLTPQARRLVREAYIKLQDNKCFFCQETLSKPAPQRIKDLEIDWSEFPDNFLRYPVHLQHDHLTGMTEGAVHNYCNAVMWQYYNQ